MNNFFFNGHYLFLPCPTVFIVKIVLFDRNQARLANKDPVFVWFILDSKHC